jgi:SRSO17 transposase
MAQRLGMGSHDRLPHFVSAGIWGAEPLEAGLMRRADRLVGGPDAYLVIDDTALPKKRDSTRSGPHPNMRRRWARTPTARRSYP